MFVLVKEEQEIRDLGDRRTRDRMSLLPTPSSKYVPFGLVDQISGSPSGKGDMFRHRRREAFKLGELLDSLHA